jgi:hypothetical protein
MGVGREGWGETGADNVPDFLRMQDFFHDRAGDRILVSGEDGIINRLRGISSLELAAAWRTGQE